jgi:hypothetical protein
MPPVSEFTHREYICILKGGRTLGNLGYIEIITLLVALATAILWIWMLIDCATNEPSGSEKVVWVLIILLGGCIGAPIYYFVRRPKRIQQTGR